MKKLLIVLLFPIALFSCSKSSTNVSPLAVTQDCNIEIQNAGKTLRVRNPNSADSTSLTYDSKGVLVSAHSTKINTDNIFFYYSGCYLDSLVTNSPSAPYDHASIKVIQRDGNLPTKVNLYYKSSSSATFTPVGYKDFYYSTDKKTELNYKLNNTYNYPMNIPSVTNTDLFFVLFL